MEARYERLKEDQKNIQNNSFNNSFDANNKVINSSNLLFLRKYSSSLNISYFNLIK